jgi:hypothetical protein
MKILLIDPHDVADAGPWSEQRWDRVVDLGLGGMNTYARWSDQFGCPVTTLGSVRHGFEDFHAVRGILGAGCGRVIDQYGLDWWEILSILLHETVEILLLVRRMAATFASQDEVYVSRPGFYADVLQYLMKRRIHSFSGSPNARNSGFRRYLRAFSRLSASQIIDVLGDKYDAGYALRGRAAGKRKPSRVPLVLLPTAYINVSRTGLAYANTFPKENFLLVATRRSGWVKDPPRNVATAWLSSYARGQRRCEEHHGIEKRWRSLLDDLTARDELEILNRLGYLNDFPRRLRHALRVRDAWRNILDGEPIQAVLCSDDSNPYTRIPLLLARERGLPNIACHHGALDGRYLFKRSHGQVIWAKGRMEKDYLVRRCGVPEGSVEIAAPAVAWNDGAGKSETKSNILFISEAYDVGHGRAQEFYRDLLPPLAELAMRNGRKLIVKLHPAESKSERASMVARILPGHLRKAMNIVSGPLTEEIFGSTWFCVTILSTVAVECAIRGIPCFLCKWLEFSPYGYIEQFICFGVGIGLNKPAEIADIPEYLEAHPRAEGLSEVMRNCWQPATADRLREYISASKRSAKGGSAEAEAVALGRAI